MRNVSAMPTVLDYKLARTYYDESGFYRPDKARPLGDQGYGMFSPAYVCSNECVSGIVQNLKPDGKTVLSIAGSGDVPFVLTAFGAKKVDTFDVSMHAELVMKIKMGMLQSDMSLLEYSGCLKSMQSQGLFCANAKVSSIIQHSLSNSELEYLDGMYGVTVVRDIRKQKNWFPNTKQYILMKQKVITPYVFIRAGIDDVFDCIGDKKYDIIYLSNILDYVVDDVMHESDETAIVGILERCTTHLNKGGVIVVNSLMRPIRKYDIQLYLENISKRVKHCGDMIYKKQIQTIFLNHR